MEVSTNEKIDLQIKTSNLGEEMEIRLSYIEEQAMRTLGIVIFISLIINVLNVLW